MGQGRRWPGPVVSVALILLLTPLTVAVAAAGAATGSAWTKARFDTANTGSNPAEAYLSTSNVASLAEDWTAKVERNASPVVSGGVVYIGCEGTPFCALDATNGTVRWKTYVGDTVAPSGAALVGNVVYVGASRPPVEYALDASNGTVLWKTLVSNTESPHWSSVTPRTPTSPRRSRTTTSTAGARRLQRAAARR